MTGETTADYHSHTHDSEKVDGTLIQRGTRPVAPISCRRSSCVPGATGFSFGEAMHAIFLFDVSGVMAQPWLDAGYECWCVDIQHPVSYDTGGITSSGKLHFVHWDLTRPWLCPVDRSEIAFVAAFPPCDHLAVSGARWFTGKGLRLLSASVSMFATSAEFCEWSQAPYLIENPVSTISTYWRKPDYTFSPHWFTGYNVDDNYTKKTCLWTGGGFQMPDQLLAEGLGEPDDRIHRAPPGPDRHNIRSKTPLGFAKAVFNANHDIERNFLPCCRRGA